MSDETEAQPIPIAQFEGEFVREMSGRLPAVTMAMAEGYPRGTILRLQVEVRVRNVRYDEIGSGEHKGELVREHVLALESARMVAAFSPEQDRSDVGGSASADAIDIDAAEGLDVTFGRTSDQWGATA